MSPAPQPTYRVFPDASTLAQAAAAELARVVSEAVAARGSASVVLTGGSMGTALMTALSGEDGGPPVAAPWSSVQVWWGDERFLPAGDPDRNDTQADTAGLGRLITVGLNPSNVHRLPGPDEPGDPGDPSDSDDFERAARQYAARLDEAVPKDRAFDVVLLGMGPDGHVASLFPHHPSTAAAANPDVSVIAVQDSPKPPPQRLSLTLPRLNAARQVWFLVTGEDKAPAVRRARTTDDPQECPAGAVRGLEATLWWLDDGAAEAGTSGLPSA